MNLFTHSLTPKGPSVVTRIFKNKAGSHDVNFEFTILRFLMNVRNFKSFMRI